MPVRFSRWRNRRRAVPTLLELQRAMRASLVDRDDSAAAAMLADDLSPDRLNIYRNTFVSSVTKALRLSYPAVHRLVGADFFEGAAGLFIARSPPRSAWLDEYGADFAEFLRDFQPASSLAYLPDVARLEWAVNRAIHAAEVEPLDLARLSALPPEDQIRVCFVPHPSITVMSVDYPADIIWRGVLSGDDAALAAVNLDAGPLHLLVELRATGVEVSRLDDAAWKLATMLCKGRPLGEVFAEAAETACDALLAEHLASGRFIDFRLAPAELAVLTSLPEAVS
jgi:hypothetical protein